LFPLPFPLPLFFGFLLGALIGGLAWRVRALSASGAIAAAVSGGLIFGLGGVSWAVLLLAFFISSSGLSRAFSRQKAGVNEKFSKGNRRDWGQVLANGGLGALLAVAHGLFPAQPWPWLAYAGAMAAVNADTWATELGVLSPHPPRRITTGRVVERGASGGISLLGTLAALAGGLLIGGFMAVFADGRGILFALGIVPLAGLMGSLFDSFLGATVQVIYRCPACDKETERYPRHLCGTLTYRIRGWRWLNNDWVNFACSLVGAGLVIGMKFLLGI
jgi:uncharacterized protein (TIGR00297 family)